MKLSATLTKELEKLAANRKMPLNDYIVEKLWAIVRLNQIKGPED